MFRLYSNPDYILFMGCKIESACFSRWFWYLTGSFAKPADSIVKTAGRNPIFMTPGSIGKTALPSGCHQFQPFIQGTAWSMFTIHNETSNCSKNLLPIKMME
ncbi:hypothetical protein [Mediterraneibacter gnavus]|uniref:Uncharacterized protein n=1 Tax=Mediterraneibacter gnavus TaxID=33038 RepID=A0AAJ1B8E2_MEDGN|nr:hypothetical protein [Mediterraneibacter gnavus]MCB5620820.1 hypothetical protein [Mediterraneibacter gnavus]MCB5666092.1 hypothetical protein [Mediterraneibacter gnavus]MCB5683138.1 hypothetical protein [Mediterraneibacter gnavus]NSH70265.1 hypothetical protein [Mediterraneibacter gnavus]NSH80538.1 hypothetical protein [Mediterraneibacter gnavus]